MQTGKDNSVVIIRYVNTRSTALSLTHATEIYRLELPRGGGGDEDEGSSALLGNFEK